MRSIVRANLKLQIMTDYRGLLSSVPSHSKLSLKAAKLADMRRPLTPNDAEEGKTAPRKGAALRKSERSRG